MNDVKLMDLGVFMNIDFDKFANDEYELFLPNPIFSDLNIQKSLQANTRYVSTLRIHNHGEGVFFAYIEVIGEGLSINTPCLEGNKLDLEYVISTKGLKANESLEGIILITYLGGERIIPYRILVEEVEAVQDKEEDVIPPKRTKVIERVNLAYHVRASKRAFSIDEAAQILILNHEPSPLSVKVSIEDKELRCEQGHLTVNDIGKVRIALVQSWLDRYITKKHYKKPIITKEVRLTIKHENGTDECLMPIVFSTLIDPKEKVEIKDDRDYKRSILKVQSYYNQYIITDKKVYLKKAVELIEKAMAYHESDVELRLYYILLLLEDQDQAIVKEQIHSILKFSDYYLEDHYERLIEVLNVLEVWLDGYDVTDQVRDWPLTPYRQLFKYRVFKNQNTRFDVFESLYLAGFRHTHLFAMATKSLIEHPKVPSHHSKFYASVLMWALNKNCVQEAWLDSIERSYYHIVKNDLINSNVCYKLYFIRQSDDMLKLLTTTLINENAYTIEAYSIYYEVLKRKIFIRDVYLHYIKTAVKHRLPVDIDYIQMSMAKGELTHEDEAYIYMSYFKDIRSEKGYNNALIRRFNHFIGDCLHNNLSEDEQWLIQYFLIQQIETFQWKRIKETITKPILCYLLDTYGDIVQRLVSDGYEALGPEWLMDQLDLAQIISYCHKDNRLRFLEFMADQHLDDALIHLCHNQVFDLLEDTHKEALSLYVYESHQGYGREIGRLLYESGYKSKELVELLMTGFMGPVKTYLDLYESGLSYNLQDVNFMETLLFKGMTTRLYPDRMMKVYLAYRQLNAEKLVVETVNRFFIAQILIEDQYGFDALIDVFEEDMSQTSDYLPMSIALLRLYQIYGLESKAMAKNLIKNVVKNGIIFPWFSSLAKPYMQTSELRKATFFSYHGKPYVKVTMYYRADDQQAFQVMQMKHAFYGFYIGYIIAFYMDNIEYYFEEENPQGEKTITESGLYIQDTMIEGESLEDTFDIVNTIQMSRWMEDEDSAEKIIEQSIAKKRVMTEGLHIL